MIRRLLIGSAITLIGGSALAQLNPGPTPVTGVGAGTVSAVTCAGGLSCSPNPIVGGGTITGAGLTANTFTGTQTFTAGTTGFPSMIIPGGSRQTGTIATGSVYFDTSLNALYYRNSAGWVGPLGAGGGGTGCNPSPSALNAFLLDDGAGACKDYTGGNLIATPQGGTGLSSLNNGSILYANGAVWGQAQLTSAWLWSMPNSISVIGSTTVLEPNFPFNGAGLGGIPGTITSVDAGCSNCSGGPVTFTFAININGSPVTCGGATVTVTASTNTNTACTANNTLALTNTVTIVVSATTGAPVGGWVKVNYIHMAY